VALDVLARNACHLYCCLCVHHCAVLTSHPLPPQGMGCRWRGCDATTNDLRTLSKRKRLRSFSLHASGSPCKCTCRSIYPHSRTHTHGCALALALILSHSLFLRQSSTLTRLLLDVSSSSSSSNSSTSIVGIRQLLDPLALELCTPGRTISTWRSQTTQRCHTKLLLRLLLIQCHYTC
jgi:hypothetical protein